MFLMSTTTRAKPGSFKSVASTACRSAMAPPGLPQPNWVTPVAASTSSANIFDHPLAAARQYGDGATRGRMST